MGVTGYQKDNLASIMIDDIFQTNLAINAGSFDFWDLDTLEIHRGAQSTTQGVNSLAGSILLNHHKASKKNEGTVKIGAAQYGKKEVGAVVNNKINDKFQTRLAYNKQISDGFITNTKSGNDHWGETNKDHFTTDLIYQLKANEELRLNMKLLRNHVGGSYVQGNDPFLHEVSEDVDFGRTTNNQQVAITYTKNHSENFSHKITLAGSQAREITNSDADGTKKDLTGIKHEKATDNFTSIESLFQYHQSKIKNVFGIHLHHYNLTNHYDFNILYPLTSTINTELVTLQDSQKHRSVGALFNSIFYRLSDHHSINLGARVEHVRNKYDATIDAKRSEDLGGANATVDAFLNRVSGSYGDSNNKTMILPKIGYLYQIDEHSIGAYYTQGYRIGGLSINRYRSEVNTYSPEKTNNYELSYKYAKQKFSFTTNIFYIDWQKQQVEVKLSNQFYDTQVQNASSSALYGSEVEGIYQFKNSDKLRVNLGHVETEFKKFNNDGINYAGNQFPDASHWTSQASFWKNISDDFTTILTARYLSDSFSNAENTKKAPEQYYLDFNTLYSFHDYILELYVKNVFDKQFHLYDGSPSSSAAAANYQASYHRVNSPREIGFRLNYYW